MSKATEGLTINQLAERNAEHVTTIESLRAQITALTSQLESVVAENAALKDVDAWMKADQVGGEAADKAFDDGATPDEATRAGVQAVIDSIKTPATDAFLAEVRASGVEMLLSSLPPYYTARADIEKFAAQLRLGGAV